MESACRPPGICWPGSARSRAGARGQPGMPGIPLPVTSPGRATAGPPRNRVLTPSTGWGGSRVRLATALFLRRPSSRPSSRMRTVGLPFRLGMVSRWNGMERPHHVCRTIYGASVCGMSGNM